MPGSLRLDYLNEVYGDSTICFAMRIPPAQDAPQNRTQTVSALIKEGSEAQQAVLNLSENPTEDQIRKTHTELKEAAVAHIAAIAQLELKYANVFPQRKTPVDDTGTNLKVVTT